MSAQSITRITFIDNKIKGFNGRTKVDEIDLSALDLDRYKQAVNETEKQLVKLDWMPEGDAKTWRIGNGKQFGKDLTQIRKFCDKLVAAPDAKLKVKPVSEKAVEAKQPKEEKKKGEKSERQLAHEARVAAKKKETAEKREKKEAEKAAKRKAREEERAKRLASPRDPKKMYVAPEQRKRKSLRTTVEDALDAYVIDVVKSRRMLKMKLLEEVARDNKLVPKGRDNGHIKMNVQNQLRALFVSEQPVTIAGKEYVISEKELAAYAASIAKEVDEEEEGGEE